MDNSVQIYNYHKGWADHRDGHPCPSEPNAAEGWRDREQRIATTVIMPARSEGYYHTKPEGDL